MEEGTFPLNGKVPVQYCSKPSIQWVPPARDGSDVKFQCGLREDLSSGGGVWQKSASSFTGCIYGVPKKLYNQNKEAYTPQAVVIGPTHYGKELLRPMQLNKEHYYDCFFCQTGHDKLRYQQMAKFYWEEEARKCYQIKIPLDSEAFVKMLLVDGIFILEFLLRKCLVKPQEENDEIFDKPSLRDDILYDMILVENQPPFFVLRDLYNASYTGLSWEEFLFKVANAYFERGVCLEKAMVALKRGNTRHLADFLHALCVCSISKRKSWPPKSGRRKFELSRSATELHIAGVEFEKVDSNLPFDLVFSRTDGLLKFPAVKVNRWTDYFFRNFIAHEDCLHKDKIISSYIILMSSLLKTSEDVDLLLDLGIIVNRSLRNSEDVCTLIKSLYSRGMMGNSEFYYASLCEDLDNYSKDSWHQWKAAWYKWKEMLKHEYFKSPWSIISVFAASIGLTLAIIQTVSSVTTVKWKW